MLPDEEDGKVPPWEETNDGECIPTRLTVEPLSHIDFCTKCNFDGESSA
jgi:hypothetical protein